MKHKKPQTIINHLADISKNSAKYPLSFLQQLISLCNNLLKSNSFSFDQKTKIALYKDKIRLTVIDIMELEMIINQKREIV